VVVAVFGADVDGRLALANGFVGAILRVEDAAEELVGLGVAGIGGEGGTKHGGGVVGVAGLEGFVGGGGISAEREGNQRESAEQKQLEEAG